MPRLAYGPWGESMTELRAAAAEAEARGADSLWVSEMHRTAFVQAAAIAGSTSRVPIGTAVALAFVRSPLITALSSLDLDELSAGRFILGLGTGVRRLIEEWHARPYGRPAAHLRETIHLVRTLVAEVHRDGPIDYAGEFEHVRLRGFQRPFAPVRTGLPIYVGGMGPATLRLSGEVADGWIAHELCSPRYLVERALPRIRDGLRRAGRDRSSFTVMASACCLPSGDARGARRLAAGLVAFYATVRTYDDFFDFHGFLPAARAIQRRFAEGDLPGMVDACPDELVDALTLVGSPDQIRARLGEYDGLADVIKLTPPTHHVSPEVTREGQVAILDLIAET